MASRKRSRHPLVCMEATGIYWEEVAQFLATRGFQVSVINPAQIKAYAASRLARTKTQERQHFSRKLKWGPSDFSGEKLAGD